jgi:biopolymer transport protein ExbB
MEDAIQEQLLHELPKLHRCTSSLATFANVAPLLGLLGTVAGIIRTFSVITQFGNANPVLMAGGISEALIATAFGLIVAVPVVIVHSLLRSRCERVLADAERHAASLLTALCHEPVAAATEGRTTGARTRVNHRPAKSAVPAPLAAANAARTANETDQVEESAVD